VFCTLQACFPLSAQAARRASFFSFIHLLVLFFFRHVFFCSWSFSCFLVVGVFGLVGGVLVLWGVFFWCGGVWGFFFFGVCCCCRFFSSPSLESLVARTVCSSTLLSFLCAEFFGFCVFFATFPATFSLFFLAYSLGGTLFISIPSFFSSAMELRNRRAFVTRLESVRLGRESLFTLFVLTSNSFSVPAPSSFDPLFLSVFTLG